MKTSNTVKVLAFLGILSCTVWLMGAATEEAAAPKESSANEKLPLNDLQRFTTVIENIKNYYVKPCQINLAPADHSKLNGQLY